jgi:hypothetical protein
LFAIEIEAVRRGEQAEIVMAAIENGVETELRHRVLPVLEEHFAKEGDAIALQLMLRSILMLVSRETRADLADQPLDSYWGCPGIQFLEGIMREMPMLSMLGIPEGAVLSRIGDRVPKTFGELLQTVEELVTQLETGTMESLELAGAMSPTRDFLMTLTFKKE